jgi:hypothetical protein
MFIPHFKAEIIRVGNSEGIIIPYTILTQNGMARGEEYIFIIRKIKKKVNPNDNEC